jgi:hypothetical protein
MTLGELMLSVLASGAMGTVAWALLRQLATDWPGIARLSTLAKRGIVWALCIAGVGALFAGAVAMRWLPAPVDARAWLNAIGDYALVGITVSQGLHALDRDAAARKAPAPQG